jgi:hypothetical protein
MPVGFHASTQPTQTTTGAPEDLPDEWETRKENSEYATDGRDGKGEEYAQMTRVVLQRLTN